MTVIALKKYLVSRINLIEDDYVLDTIKKIVDKKESEVYELSDYHLQKLDKSRKQFEKGNFFTQDQVDLKVEKWLNEQ